jgi:hypothetical protein
MALILCYDHNLRTVHYLRSFSGSLRYPPVQKFPTTMLLLAVPESYVLALNNYLPNFIQMTSETFVYSVMAEIGLTALS